MRMFTISNQSFIPMAYNEFDDTGRMQSTADNEWDIAPGFYDATEASFTQ